jgi:cytochrome c biogenesis protein
MTRALSSPRLAIVLLISVAVLSVLGTFTQGVGDNGIRGPFLEAARFLGFGDPFTHPLFVSLVAFLCLNIVFCTTQRFTIRHKAAESSPSSRRRLLPWLDGGVHLSILVILAGGVIKGTMGFVATQYCFIGVPSNTAYEWRTDRELILDFAVIPREKVEEYHPLQARIGVKDSTSGEKVALLELWGGQKAGIPGGEARLRLIGRDRENGLVRFEVQEGDEQKILEVESRKGGRADVEFGRYSFVLVAWREELKTVRTLMAILEGERVVKEEWLVPNSSIGYRGTHLYQTAWGVDEEGNSFVGIQFSRDPGAPIFWAGAVAFGVLLPAFLFVRHRR